MKESSPLKLEFMYVLIICSQSVNVPYLQWVRFKNSINNRSDEEKNTNKARQIPWRKVCQKIHKNICLQIKSYAIIANLTNMRRIYSRSAKILRYKVKDIIQLRNVWLIYKTGEGIIRRGYRRFLKSNRSVSSPNLSPHFLLHLWVSFTLSSFTYFLRILYS